MDTHNQFDSLPPEIQAKMRDDRQDAEEGLWWMIEHPEINSFYWSLIGWKINRDRAFKYTTRGEAEASASNYRQLALDGFRITQHGPAGIIANAPITNHSPMTTKTND